MKSSAPLFQQGKAFDKPLKQSLLPVIVPFKGGMIPTEEQLQQGVQCVGEVRGYIVVASTDYTGAETEQNVAGQRLKLMRVTKPIDSINSEGESIAPVPEYMAVYCNSEDSMYEAWKHWPNFFGPTEVSAYALWSAPGWNATLTRDPGTLIHAIDHNVNPGVPGDPDEPVIPVFPGDIRWRTSVTANAHTCSFFDFNWITLFMEAHTSPVKYDTLTIKTVANPPGNEFKAAIVQSSPILGPDGKTVFDTLRVIRLARNLPTVNTDYEFTFEIEATLGGKVVKSFATLTLTYVPSRLA